MHWIVRTDGGLVYRRGVDLSQKRAHRALRVDNPDDLVAGRAIWDQAEEPVLRVLPHSSEALSMRYGFYGFRGIDTLGYTVLGIWRSRMLSG